LRAKGDIMLAKVYSSSLLGIDAYTVELGRPCWPAVFPPSFPILPWKKP